MKTVTFIVIVAVAFIGSIYWLCAHRIEDDCIATGISNPRWSSKGNILYVADKDLLPSASSALTLYNISTKTKTRHPLEGLPEEYDISPDDLYVIGSSWDPESGGYVFLGDLSDGSVKTVSSIYASNVYWISNDKLIVLPYSKGKSNHPILLSLATNSSSQLPITVNDFVLGSDKKVLVYIANGWTYLYNIQTQNVSKITPIPADFTLDNVLYLSEEYLVYGYRYTGTQERTRRIDLATMKSEPWIMSPPMTGMLSYWAISPDMSHYFVYELEGGDSYNNRSSLQVYKIQ